MGAPSKIYNLRLLCPPPDLMPTPAYAYKLIKYAYNILIILVYNRDVTDRTFSFPAGAG